MKLYYCFFYLRFTKDKVKVTLGEYSFDQEGETSVQKKIGIRSWKNHERYNDKTFENDIAILKLSQDAQFTQSVQPACLPIGDSDYNNVKVKFVFSKKATKIDKILTSIWHLLHKCQIDGEEIVIFCGLLRKHELYAP